MLTFDNDENNWYPRNISNEILVADFGVLNIPNDKFQFKSLSMNFDSVDFKWFTSPNSAQVRF